MKSWINKNTILLFLISILILYSCKKEQHEDFYTPKYKMSTWTKSKSRVISESDFNKFGYKIKTKIYYEPVSDSEYVITNYEINYLYDQKSGILQGFIKKNANDILLNTYYKLTFNSEGQIIQAEQNSELARYKYDLQGRLIEKYYKFTFNPYGFSEFDSNSIIRLTQFNYENELLTQTITIDSITNNTIICDFYYSQDNSLLVKSESKKENIIMGFSIFHYDKKGDFDYIITNGNTISDSIKHEYLFDNFGRLIKDNIGNINEFTDDFNPKPIINPCHYDRVLYENIILSTYNYY